MSEIMDKINGIKSMQVTIDLLLKHDLVTANPHGSPNVSKWNIEEYYFGEDCNFGFAYSDPAGSKDFPPHCHGSSKEYLICTQGSVLLTILNVTNRILTIGECASIPAGVSHSTKPLLPGTKLVYVCVPTDKAFPGCVKNLEIL